MLGRACVLLGRGSIITLLWGAHFYFLLLAVFSKNTRQQEQEANGTSMARKSKSKETTKNDKEEDEADESSSKTAAATTTETSKVSSSSVVVPPTEEEWDLIRVLGNDGDESCACRHEDCNDRAVATWTSNLDPNDEWNVCEEHQLIDFGGWPEGVEPPAEEEEATTSEDKQETTKSNDADQNSTNEQPGTTTFEEDPTTTTTTTTTSDDNPTKDDDDDDDDTSNAVSTANMEVEEDANASNEDSNIPPPPSPLKKNSSADDEEEAEMEADDDDKSMDEEEEGEDDEMWDLKKIMSIAEITTAAPIMCNTEDCPLLACCVYQSQQDSTTKNPPSKWYSCIDCQENDYDGWPAEIKDFPIDCTCISPEHRRVMIAKCSRQKKPAMPTLFLSSEQQQSDSTSPTTTSGEEQQKQTKNANFVTPPPNSLASVSHQAKGNQTATMTGVSGKAKITPNPQAAVANKSMLLTHKKWQDAAEAMGDKTTRLVVKKPQAKKLVFDLLFDAFKPMNITEIYNVSAVSLPLCEATSLERASSGAGSLHSSSRVNAGSTILPSSYIYNISNHCFLHLKGIESRGSLDHLERLLARDGLGGRSRRLEPIFRQRRRRGDHKHQGKSSNQHYLYVGTLCGSSSVQGWQEQGY
jgi:hypothetical protein